MVLRVYFTTNFAIVWMPCYIWVVILVVIDVIADFFGLLLWFFLWVFQNGRKEHSGVMRNKDWEVCPVGGMAFWFFYLFHFWQKPEYEGPDFSTRGSWWVFIVEDLFCNYLLHVNTGDVAFTKLCLSMLCFYEIIVLLLFVWFCRYQDVVFPNNINPEMPHTGLGKGDTRNGQCEENLGQRGTRELPFEGVEQKLTYYNHYNAILAGFMAAEIVSNAKTHAMRGCGARNADQEG
jgi:hypothetical protein